MRQIAITTFIALACLATGAHAVEVDRYQDLEGANKLERDGRLEDAFLAFLKVPGAEHRAAEIGRSEPDRFLKTLRERDIDGSPVAIKAVEGDLLLAAGDRPGALACYRAASEYLADAKFVETYLAEPPGKANPDFPPVAFVDPFALGPGSHRDNWLIRRFIALEAWEDSAREFARLWQIHRRNARPYLVDVDVYDAEGKRTKLRRFVLPRGFNGRGLQFALDYAFFLKKTDKLRDALKMLTEPLLAIDMDRDPNHMVFFADPPSDGSEKVPLRQLAQPVSTDPFGHHSLGISRKELIRLAYGMYKESGTEDQLVRMLQKRIEQGENSLRRTLARIRLHQNRLDDVLSLELEYIDQSAFDPLSAAYRRGLVYEDTGHQEQAIGEYQRALQMPFQPVRRPDAEERVSPGMMQQAIATPAFAPDHASSGKAGFHTELLSRLERLYSGMGDGETAFEMALRRLEIAPNSFNNLQELAHTQTRARTLGREGQFQQWLRDRVSKISDATQRANVLWTLEEYGACADALAASWADHTDTGGRYALDPWVQRYRGLGDDRLRQFLDAVLDADPANSQARLERLALQVSWSEAEKIDEFEALLQPKAELIFRRGKGVYNRTPFRNYFDLAYRLMRLYERADQIGQLRSLGLRIAAGDKPFGDWLNPSGEVYDYRNENDWPEDVNSCLALLIQHADEATLAQLDRLWADRGDFPAQRQLARRHAGRFTLEKAPADLGWSNLPAGVRALVGTRTVLSLTCDEHHIYSGHPWGVAVYDLEGRPITRIALGEAALALAAQNGVVWAGTPKGLFKIQRNDWTVHHLWLNGDVDPGSLRPVDPSEPASYWHDNCVHALVLEKDQLWIGTHRNLQRLDTRTNRLRAYSSRELKIDRPSAFSRILTDGRYVWAQCDAGLRRWDRNSDTWQSIDFGQRGVGLIGMVDGRLFGHAWLNDQLRDRPCLIDRDTLTVAPLLIEGNLSDSERMINGPFSFHGWYDGRLVFSPGYPLFAFDESIGALRPLGDDPSSVQIDTPLPPGFRYGDLWWARPVSAAGGDAPPAAAGLCVHQWEGDAWTLLQLPTGRLLVGKRPSYAPRYQYPREDWPYRDRFSDRKEDRGGVHFVDPDTTVDSITTLDFGDGIRGDTVFAAVDDPASDVTWLCTDLGLVAVDRDGRVRGSFTRSDGLCANRITSGVVVGDGLYCSSAWGDHGGGLLLADPATAVFTARVDSDGLATSKIARIEPTGERLRVVYDVEYGRYKEYDYRLFPPGIFDTETNRIVSGGEPQYPSQADAYKIVAQRAGTPDRLMPYLGGFVTGQYSIAGKTYLCGTRGVVLLDEAGIQPRPFEQLAVQLDVDPHNVWKQQADALSVSVSNPATLEPYLTHENPYVRYKAVMSTHWRILQGPEAYTSILKTLARDSYAPLRLVAVESLGKMDAETAASTLRKLTSDSDVRVRDAATMALARFGQPPAIDDLKRMLAARREPSDQFEVIRAVAPTATAETFGVLLKYPLTTDDYQPRQAVFDTLGKSVLHHPDSIDVLLTAYTHPQDPGPDSNFGAARFAQEVFKHAGTRLLPRLHQALQSTHRVVRSNAARGCGAIGDLTSIASLIEALDLESGLSRASIVWALGELKAKEALPQLADLYTDARNDEQRNRGAGFRVAQAVAQVESQYDTIGRMDEIDSDWDELKQLASPTPIDPRRNEPLLSTSIVLAAVRKIGPEFSQTFYRQLAGEKDAGARREAAEQLAAAAVEDRGDNLPILRNLLADRATDVQMAAAVSLLILDRSEVQPQILAWLKSPETWQRDQIAVQLQRVEDGVRLGFAREAIEAAARDMSINSTFRQHFQHLLSRIPKR